MSTKKPSKVRRKDPFFEREAARYAMPLPSREYIQQMLEEQGRPVFFERLCELLDIRKGELEPFERRLLAMEREAQIMRNRKGAFILPERASLIPGRIEGHADGYGFLIPDDGSEDIFLDAKQMSKVLHRDRALVRAIGVDRKGRPEGVIVEVLERANSRVVGRVLIEHGIAVVVPENRRITFITKALGDHTRRLPERLRVGDRVTVEGPYGCFTFDDGRARQIWIGAGIGITPFIARMKFLAQHEGQDARPIDLFHPTSDVDPQAIEKLRADSQAAGVVLHLLIDKQNGRLTGERLRAMVPGWKDASVWFCGPTAFGRALRADLLAQGLEPEAFHQELFEMR